MITQDPETELQIRFQNSCIMATELHRLSKNEEYFLYGLQKQAEEGDNYTPTPWLFNIPERCKWEAWNRQQGKSKIIAMYDYINAVANFQLKYT
jgi:acyl-CoA-binding protein